jgi:hypothetical protein
MRFLEHANACRADVDDPLLRRLYDYWEEKRGERPMPARADIDPVDMRFILGSVLVADVLREPLRFFVRLHGTELVRRAGYELSGKMLDDLPRPQFRALTHRSWAKSVETRAPFHAIGERILDGRSARYEALILPLSRASDDVNMLLVGMRYRDQAG